MSEFVDRPTFDGLWSCGQRQPPLVVAELSGNHNQSLERALQLVDAAADCGAHAIKLQTYTADTITLDVNGGDFVVNQPASPWHGRTLHSLYDEAHTPWEWHEPIIRRAEARGIAWFSSPFDLTSVDFLEELGAPLYKVASPEIVDLPLIARIAATGRPLVISTGMSTEEEIGEAVAAAREAGAREVMLLKCTSTYPAAPRDTNLRALSRLGSAFGVPVGLSDHTLGIGVAVASVAFGASLIEKHFTLARSDGGPDAAFSLEPAEFSALVDEVQRAWEALGSGALGPVESERPSLQGRRSLYIVKDLPAGTVLAPEHFRSVRPGFGLPPKFANICVGRRLRQSVTAGTPLSWELFEPESDGHV